MTIGKRHQIAIGAVATIVLIAVLHMLIFAPQQRALQKAKADFDEKSITMSGMTRANSKEDLDNFAATTAQMLSELEEGISHLGMETSEVFILPPPEDPELFPQLLLKLPQQVDMILVEIDRLARFRASQTTRMTFLDRTMWAIPSELPATMQTSQLWDLLDRMTDTRGLLQSATEGGDVHTRAQAQYNLYLQQIGLDVKKLEQLKEYGEFVPIYYQLQIVNLILRQIPEGDPVLTRGRVLDRDYLMEIVNVKSPTDPLEHLNDALSYFVYQYVHFVNIVLQEAETHGIVEITNVTLWGQAFLRLAPTEKQLPGDKIVAPGSLTDDRRLSYNYFAAGAPAAGSAVNDAWANWNALNYLSQEQIANLESRNYDRETIATFLPDELQDFGIYIDMDSDEMGSLFGAQAAATPAPKQDTKPREGEDIGYAFPVEVTFRAPNKEGWQFIYDVLNKSPLNELYRISTISMSSQRPADPNIEFTVTFLFVSKLFQTIDTVRQLLKELEGTSAAPTPVPSAD